MQYSNGKRLKMLNKGLIRRKKQSVDLSVYIMFFFCYLFFLAFFVFDIFLSNILVLFKRSRSLSVPQDFVSYCSLHKIISRLTSSQTTLHLTVSLMSQTFPTILYCTTELKRLLRFQSDVFAVTIVDNRFIQRSLTSQNQVETL